jgi:hypothetical protein
LLVIFLDPSLVAHMDYLAGINRASTMRDLLATWTLADCAFQGTLYSVATLFHDTVLVLVWSGVYVQIPGVKQSSAYNNSSHTRYKSV